MTPDELATLRAAATTGSTSEWWAQRETVTRLLDELKRLQPPARTCTASFMPMSSQYAAFCHLPEGHAGKHEGEYGATWGAVLSEPHE